MANTKSARKSLIKSKQQRKCNASRRSMLRTFIKKVYTAIESKDKSAAITAFVFMQKKIDHQACKGLIHKNKAARCKSRAYARIKSMEF
ncbi:30S ribosomal protein S20 [Candidatus Blochmanniella camponoti]|uniref:Small ribosomal subunit protein bS20 n=1 Tax=Candidatus Blochmanniella camponoti TaxID=108080 RepID=A0AAE9I924_9ENTR|nr:30S ribosomal protein S20 [Candidatus Blochmannia herculeanus]URJ24554.1 30S ribosomal protein S20 [Candidatus Blochmannia herculeanus]URJ26838.1 30S ribosomal protein S20 [Candidatus Blochmannia herculeanus]URJ27357.1 30S ribosomal protein S20 [Candidatus Blochmannia herculeanus]